MAVRVRQRARRLGRDLHRVLERQLLLALQAIAQRLALDVRHDVIEEAGRGAGVVQGQDVGMLQPGGDLDLAQKPLGAERGRDLGVQDLDRHRSAVFQVLRQEHRGHASTAQLPLDRVAVSEGLTQGVEQIGHGTWGLAYNPGPPPASTPAPPLLSCRGSFPYLYRSHDQSSARSATSWARSSGWPRVSTTSGSTRASPKSSA